MTDGDSLQDARYAPPRAPVEDIRGDAAGPELAGRGVRLVALLLDTLLLMALFWVVSRLTGWNPWADDGSRSWWEPVLLTPVISTALFCLLNGYHLARRGQTLGKSALGIRIVRADGSPASAARLLGLRYGVSSALGVVPALEQIFWFVSGLLIVRSSRRCLHDVIADTIVVKA